MKKRILLITGATALALVLASCGGDPFATSIYTAQPAIVTYDQYLASAGALPAEGVDPILATGTPKGTITKGKLVFKDSNGNGKLDKYEDWRLPARERAADLIARMSPEEKLGLMSWNGGSGSGSMTKAEDGTLLYGIQGLNEDGTIQEKVTGAMGPTTSMAYSVLTDGIRYGNEQFERAPLDEVKYNNNLQGLAERTAYGIPFIVSSDPSHIGWTGDELGVNHLSKWPYYMGLGALDDLATTKEFGEIMAQEFRMMGHHQLLGPQADIATEPRWARIQHLFHADADITASHIEVLIKAMQGGDSLRPTGIAATVKHFPGSGSVMEGMDSHTASGQYSIYPGNNFDAHLVPFKAALKANVAAVMALYSIVDLPEYKDLVDGKPIDEGSAFSTKIMTDLLKTELGFDGAIVTDWSVADQASWGHQDIKNTGKIMAELLNAGTYMYGGSNLTNYWKEAYTEGLITAEKIDVAALHAVELQFKLGLFENPYVDIKAAEEFWNPEGKAMKVRMAAGRAAMSKAIVLAENRDVVPGITALPVLGTNPDYVAAMDINGNGTFDVYFDSAYPDADSGQAKTLAVSTANQYLNTTFVDSIEKADMVIARVFSRGATYFGTQGGTPLSFTTPVRVWDRATMSYTDEVVSTLEQSFQAFGQFGAWTFNDWSHVTGPGFIGQGFQTYLGGRDSQAVIDRVLAAKKANPKLKVVIGMTDSRPGIVSSFVDKVDALLIDFAATDKAFLDVVFWQEGIEPKGKLPVEIPADDASVEAQLEDVPGDTADPTYEIGYGLGYQVVGGYGYGGN